MDSVQTTAALAARLIRAAAAGGLRLACAESCTGGLLAAALTAVPGASIVFPGAVVAYENRVKERLLSVPAAVLEASGAVSRDCVSAMARGARALFEADIALSVSGIAGPGGGTPEKPVGTVWFGLDSSGILKEQCYHFEGDRNSIRAQAVVAALKLLEAAVSA